MSLSDAIYNCIWKYSLIFCISYLVILSNLKIMLVHTSLSSSLEKKSELTLIKKETQSNCEHILWKKLVADFDSILKMYVALTLSRYLDKCIMPTSNIIYSTQTYGNLYSIFNHSKQTLNKLPCVIWHWMLILYFHNVTFPLPLFYWVFM